MMNMDAALAGLEQAARTAAEQLSAKIAGRSFGQLKVIAAVASVGFDADDDLSIYLDLTVSDPPAGEDTWRLEDTDRLRQAIVSEAEGLQRDIGVYLRLSPATEPVQEE